MTVEEFHAAADALDTRERTILFLACLAGMRHGELLALQRGDFAAIFALADGLEVLEPHAASDMVENIGLLIGLIGRKQHCHGLADNLGCGISVDSLGPRVRRYYAPVEILADDCVFGGVNDRSLLGNCGFGTTQVGNFRHFYLWMNSAAQRETLPLAFRLRLLLWRLAAKPIPRGRRSRCSSKRASITETRRADYCLVRSRYPAR